MLFFMHVRNRLYSRFILYECKQIKAKLTSYWDVCLLFFVEIHDVNDWMSNLNYIDIIIWIPAIFRSRCAQCNAVYLFVSCFAIPRIASQSKSVLNTLWVFLFSSAIRTFSCRSDLFFFGGIRKWQIVSFCWQQKQNDQSS